MTLGMDKGRPAGTARLWCVVAGIMLGGFLAAGCSAKPPPPAPSLIPSTNAFVVTPVKDAFPGAEGYGRKTPGGRGGRIIPVTTLADSGPGTLRACIEADGPRVCIFRVSGVIRYTTERPIIRNPFITIAGQTAPGGGILLTHAGGAAGLTPLVIKNTHDVIVRHIRIRPDRRGDQREANSAITIEGSRNIMIDHVSTSWALDENIGGFADNDNITISNSIFAEGIPKHDKCALLMSHPAGPEHVSFLRNLCAHNGDRNPNLNFTPGSCVEVVNNVLYNGVVEFAEIWETYGGTPVSIVGNYFRAGPNTKAGFAHGLVYQSVGSTGHARLYETENIFDGLVPENEGISAVKVSSPPCPLTVKPLSADAAYKAVLAHSGALPRDSVDHRIVHEVATRSGHIVSTFGQLPIIASGRSYQDSDGDGISDEWEAAHGTNPRKFDAWDDKDGNGWTNLDEFLASLSAALIAQP